MESSFNPFILNGYKGPEYFCDREQESEYLIKELADGNNLLLIGARRIGKTSLLTHCFHSPELRDRHAFFIDIYATKTLRDFVCALSKSILNTLKSPGRKALEKFITTVSSIRPTMTFDSSGAVTFSLQPGDISREEVTLEQIFRYLESADSPCIVAIDEFQQIAAYPEKNTEAVLRTYVQHCNNTCFVFAGSKRHVLAQMFQSPSRPFYQSVSNMSLGCIDPQKYADFAAGHFRRAGKKLEPQVVPQVFERVDGITLYIQRVLRDLFEATDPGETCTAEMIDPVIDNIVNTLESNFVEIMFRLPEKQRDLLVAISAAGKAVNITSSDFIRRYGLASASSVQSAAKGLLEKDFITFERGVYSLCDKFLSIWLNKIYI